MTCLILMCTCIINIVFLLIKKNTALGKVPKLYSPGHATHAMKGAILIINCKNYDQISTRPRLKRLLAAACAVATRYNIRIAVAPPQHLIGDAVRLLEEDIDCGKKSMVIVLAQHADCHNTGSTTGYVIPEMLKRAGVAGSIINHSEHRIRQADAACAVKRLNELNMLSVLCVRNVKGDKKICRHESRLCCNRAA